jgi:hypothetical protein
MILNRLLPALLLACAALPMWAEDSDKEALKATAATAAVKEDLATPDGASMRIMPNGGWQIFGQGTAAYDFTDEDEINDAKKEAMLRAKANIAKFLKETITSDEKVQEVTMKSKSLSGKDGETTESTVSKESVKVTTTKLTSRAEEVLRGVVVLEVTKTPSSKRGGTITVQVAVSDKSQAIAGQAKADMAAPATSSGSGSGAGGSETAPASGAGTPENKAEKQKSKTDL